MKKILLLLLVTVSAFSQGKITKEYLVGTWYPNEHATIINVSLDKKGGIVYGEKSTISGIELTIDDLKIKKGMLFVDSTFEPNNWKSSSIFKYIDKDTMLCIVSSEASGDVIYRREK